MVGAGRVTYPLGRAPRHGELLEVAPNVFWSRIPLPGGLDHINVWLLKNDDGYAVVDTGMYTKEAEDTWRQLIADLPSDTSIRQVFVTHFHPDHVGMAGWLVSEGAEQFWMTRLEYMTCRIVLNQSSDDEVPAEFEAFNRSAGWPESAISSYRHQYGAYRKRVSQPPLAYRRLEEGQRHTIGGSDWKIVVGNGHSPEHACFYSEELKLLISGDQVLPRISSNVSVTPMDPFANPMADWLNSLSKLKAEIPDDVMVLPAHQECFTGLHARIDELIESQKLVLAALLESLQRAPKRVFDVFEVLFSRSIPQKNLLIFNLATGEALACLNYLYECGEISCSVDSDGVRWYQAM
ncbi:MAG: MBL fold metallo-hydrolase [Marinobacter sp.]